MTNLLISYPGIPFRAVSITLNRTMASGYPANNVTTGERGKLAKADANYANLVYQFDLGSGAAETIDHLLIARADLLTYHGTMAVQLQSSVDDSVYGNRAGTNTLETRTFSGVQAEDVIFTETFNNTFGTMPGSSHRYWKLNLEATTSNAYTLSKIYFGTFFDFGREPSYPAIQNRRIQRPGNRDAVYQFTLTWQGIHNDKRNELFDKILQYRDVNPVFLYDTSDLILNGIKLLHCRILDAAITPITAQYNDVEIAFEELI